MALIIKEKSGSFNNYFEFLELPILKLEDTGSSRLSINKILIPRGEIISIESSLEDVSWIHILTGKGKFSGQEVSDKNICFIPQNNSEIFEAIENTMLLKCSVNDFRRFEKIDHEPNTDIKIINWQNEPVLQSEHDFRERIYVGTKNLWDTNAIKGEIILYPPNTKAPAHHHEGAEHFQYIMSGEGTAFINNKEVTLRAGDVVYNFENEIHWFENRTMGSFSFVEFFVPGECKTIWASDEKVCTWLPTNKDFNGKTPVRTIQKHIHGAKIDI